MTLEEALTHIIEKEGIGILSDSRLYNCLDDLHAFNHPGDKRVITTMIESDVLARLQTAITSDKGYESQFTDAENHLINEEGFQTSLVTYVLDSLLSAIHKSGIVSSSPLDSKRKQLNVKGKHNTNSNKNELKVESINDFYYVTISSHQYKLDRTQYKAIMRKKDMPLDRLEVWLETYTEENN